ncbi:MAG: dihydrofolate synthase/folylpolyglutamate synthase [Francisellaceae bacterium]|jgi:dihydrofolate synthase/folylpolyglutamate synthase
MKSNHNSLLDYLTYIENKSYENKSDLSALKRSYSSLGVEQLQSLIITVTGTNGKGSTVGLLEDIFIAQGYTVGSNTSPHLMKYNERIRYNGEAVSDEDIIFAFNAIEKAYGENNSLCYSHYAFLAGLITFIRLKPEIIILEVGLGGRLDPANTLDADISVITSIDLDHIELLGNTREKIGLEKCAIGRSGKPLVISDLNIPQTVIDYCDKNNVNVKCIQSDFTYNQKGLHFIYSNQGKNQNFILKNSTHPHSVSSVLAVLDEMPKKFIFSHSITKKIIESFFISGRKHIMQSNPYVIVDVGHNLKAVKSLFEFVATQIKRSARINVIFSAMNNKDINGIIKCADKQINHWNIVSFNHIVERGASLNQLKLSFENKTNVTYHQSIPDSYQEAKKSLRKDDCLVVFGSFILVGEILGLVNGS